MQAHTWCARSGRPDGAAFDSANLLCIQQLQRSQQHSVFAWLYAAPAITSPTRWAACHACHAPKLDLRSASKAHQPWDWEGGTGDGTEMELTWGWNWVCNWMELIGEGVWNWRGHGWNGQGLLELGREWWNGLVIGGTVWN